MRWDDRNIRELAFKRVLKPVWHRRAEFARGAVDSPLGMLPMPVDLIVTELFRLELERREDILAEGGADLRAGYQIGGLLDRELKRIEVCSRFPIAAQRFTILHELAHYLMHPGITFHRDMPLFGHEREDTGRPPMEVEADMFAAAVLMPERLTKDLFVARYGGARSPDEMDENFAYRLSRETRTQVSLDMLIFGAPRDRSLLFAVAQPLGMMSFVEIFQASKKAVAIRLEELDLVF